MTTTPKTIALLSLLGLALLGWQPAQAYTLYNTNGGSNTVGTDGQLPPSWTAGGAAPDYTGSMHVMWYADLSGNSYTLSTADALNQGAPPNFLLFGGPAAWNNVLGHGLDYGLIRLETATHLVITVAADASPLRPGFSFYRGWDTGTSFERTDSYVNNIDNPLGTVGLTYLNQAFTTAPGGSASQIFYNLPAGDYTLMLAGSGGTGAQGGKYRATLSAIKVPNPGTAWLLGAGLAGMAAARRSKTPAKHG